MAFTTKLFGGFEHSSQIYDIFTQEYDTVNTERSEYPAREGRVPPVREGESQWIGEIDGISCRITMVQPKLSEEQEYLSVIKISSDWNVFYNTSY